MRSLICIALTTLILSSVLNAQEPKDFRGWLDLAMRYFQQGRFAESVRGFEHAVRFNPSFGPARLLLSHGFLALHYVPARSPLDDGIVRPARASVENILRSDPKNPAALHALAVLHMRASEWAQVRAVYDKLVALDRNDAAAHYGIASAVFSQWYPDYEAVLHRLGWSVEDPGGHRDPFPEPIRTEMKARHMASLDAGIENLRQALAVNPQFWDAMMLISSLMRARAYLVETPEQYWQAVMEAEQWMNRCATLRRQVRH